MRGWGVVLAGLLLAVGMAGAQERPQTGWAVQGWPVRGTVEFQVAFGSAEFPVGKALHRWSHDAAQYQMELAVETTGMAALIRELGYTQKSAGELTPGGLRPRRFDVTHKGKAPEAALFDWDGARVSIRRSERERRSAPLVAGDVDILSLWHQLGHAAATPESLLVVGNKDARRAQVKRLEEESLQVPAGRFNTRVFWIQSEDGKLSIRMWLARDHHMAPVRIVIDDTRSGELVLEATSLQAPR
ncbi:hypothetical protein AGMMS50225_01250 [Betaproteobacteria bacterium]|nr:hypothetical protein AGMMS50225_01250 [Betaproteobacteria bacterium]